MLKYVVNKTNLPQFEILGSLHEYLIAKQIPVPKIYRTRVGNYVEKDFICYKFIEGETKDNWSDKEIISLVINFAHMIIALREYDVPNFIKNKNDKYTKGYDIRYCHEVFRPSILNLSVSDNIKNPIIETIDLLYNKISDFEKLPKYLVHGDVNEMNALFQDGKNVGIIDFGGGYDPIVYDLGELIYWFAMSAWKEEFNRKRCELMVCTFEEILPLSADEKKLLPYMILRRGIMDVMLTLQYYWSNQSKMSVPIERLQTLINRNNKIVELIK